MPWNGGGVFSRLRNWVTDKNNGVKIVAALHDSEDDNLATGIQACITKNNESKPTADFSPNADAAYSLGSNPLRWVRGFFASGVRIYNGTVNYVDLQAATLSGARSAILPNASGNIVLDSAAYTFTQAQTFGGVLTFNGRNVFNPQGASGGDGGGFVLRELAANGTNGITMRAPDALSGDYSITLPNAQGASGTVPTNDGSGNLTWQAPGSIFAPVGINPGDAGRLQLQELAANGSHVVRIKAADSIPVSFDLTLPAALPAIASVIEFSTSGAGSYLDVRAYADSRRDEAVLINFLQLLN